MYFKFFAAILAPKLSGCRTLCDAGGKNFRKTAEKAEDHRVVLRPVLRRQ